MNRLSPQTSGQSSSVISQPRVETVYQPATACFPRRALLCTGFALLVAVPGCGTNLNELLFQASTAASRTVLDLWLTDLANQLADSFDDDGGSADADSGGHDGHDDEHDTGGGTGPGDLTGDRVAGSAVFSANGCASCHCADAAGGCALSAPSILGAGVDRLSEFLTGATVHPLTVDLTDQELVDLEAFLVSAVEEQR